MKRSYAAWYFGIGLLLLLPVGWRVLSWTRPETPELDQSSVQAGKVLFAHEWQPNDPLARGDGLGPVFNAKSCVACHKQPILGGAGGLEHNVTTFIVQNTSGNARKPIARQGVVHTDATVPEYQETLKNVDATLPAIAQPPLAALLPPESKTRVHMPRAEGAFNIPFHVHLSQRNTPALFGSKLIDEIPDRVIIAQERLERVRFGLAGPESRDVPVGRALRLQGGQVGKFGWKSQSASLLDFVQAACANELGLSNPAHAQPTPLGRPDYQAVGLDLTTKQCVEMRDFIASLPRPEARLPEDPQARTEVEHGRQLFTKVGCADCHTPSIGSVEGIYSDLLLHRMGDELRGIGSYHGGSLPVPESPGDGPLPDEWRTPPLWGVADSAPYMHDGRAATLADAIRLHAGQAQASARRFATLPPGQQQQLIRFLESLRAP